MRIAIVGVSGRMGLCLLQAVALSKKSQLSVAVARSGSTAVGRDAGDLAAIGTLNIEVIDDLAAVTGQFDVLIDFTRPEPSLKYIEICRQAGKKIVVGTTGYSDGQKTIIAEAARDVAIVLAPNMSVGVNLVFKLLEMTAKVIGESTDIEVIEAHHRHKADAPSGTALHMGKVIADTLGYDLKAAAIYNRQPTSDKKSDKTIGFSALRAGDIVGEHTAMFAGAGERIEITHRASNRMTFANGAIRAAEWLHDKEHGLYDMQDVLGLA